jgi:preprotein translocase subunit SecB
LTFSEWSFKTMAEQTPAQSNGQAAPQMQMSLQKIYARDVSFEVPNAPKVFQEEGQPQVQLNLSHKATAIEGDNYEIVLTLTVTCTLNERTAYLAEVHQAGVFSFVGFDQENLSAVLATYCPNVLFPFARQVVSDLVLNGGFPPLLLQPINFDALYAQQQQQAQQGQPVDGGNKPTLNA